MKSFAEGNAAHSSCSKSPAGSISPFSLKGHLARCLTLLKHQAHPEASGGGLEAGRQGSKNTVGLMGPACFSSGCLQLWDKSHRGGFLLWLPGWEKGRVVAFLSSGMGGGREIIKG